MLRFPFPGRVLNGGFFNDLNIEGNPKPGDQQPAADPGKQDNGEPNREPHYGPQIVCRAFTGDAGDRPLASNAFFWESPDIWVVAPDGSNIPMAGVVNQVNVHVWNMGMAPSYGIRVDLYWCDPSVGVNLAKSHFIGSAQPFTLAAGQHQVITLDWLVDFVNGGHECLVAHAYDPVSDNLFAPFNPLQDYHVGQYNIFEIRVPVGNQIHLNFFVANLSEGMAFSEIHFEPLRGEQLQVFAQTLGLDFLPETEGAHFAITKVQVKQAQPTINLLEHPAAAVFRETLEPVPRRFVRNLLHQAIQVVPVSPKPQKEHYALQPERQKHTTEPFTEVRAQQLNLASYTYHIHPGHELALTLTISVPKHMPRAVYQAYRVIEKSEGRVTGGITYLVKAE